MSLTPLLSNRPRLASFMLLFGIAVSGAVLAFLRIPPRAAKTVWAEDGSLFLGEYLDQGPGLLAPYAGYLHLLPRLIVASVVPVFGLEAYPLGVTVACCIVLGLISALTFYCASALTANLTARLCWASIPVLVPPGAVETMGNVANLHWYLLWLAPWVVIKSPSVLSQKILLGAAALMIGLTEIQAVMFLPLILFRVKDRSLWWAKAGLASGIACQLSTLWRFPRFPGGTGETLDILSVIYGYFLNSTAAVFYGSAPVVIGQIQLFGAAPIVLSAVPFVVVTVLLAIEGSPLQRIIGSGLLLSSMVSWVASVVLNAAPYFKYATFNSAEDWERLVLSRYCLIPSMFLLALVPLLISASAEGGPATGRLATMVRSPWLRGVLVGAFLIVQSFHFFTNYDFKAGAPEWAPQIQQAQSECQSDPALEGVRIAQAPGSWFTTISCANLQP